MIARRHFARECSALTRSTTVNGAMNSPAKTTKLPPKFVRVDLQNKEAMHSVKNEIKSEEIYNKLNKYYKADPNLNYNIIN